MASLPRPADGILLTHFLVSRDVARARRFYTEVLGGETVRDDASAIIALANTWIVINTGGGPTEDKPQVTLEPPADPDRVSSFLNIRVADVHALYQLWAGRGAQFLTRPPTAAPRSAATCATPTATSSRSASSQPPRRQPDPTRSAPAQARGFPARRIPAGRNRCRATAVIASLPRAVAIRGFGGAGGERGAQRVVCGAHAEPGGKERVQQQPVGGRAKQRGDRFGRGAGEDRADPRAR
jgi:Glyoxalase/Bleomycin resistance protein/Dioxygenase superfamily